ncbi:hypothetical protein [Nocardioides sp.]|uniref:hypothetical protein n=1 Tax=Nocardioides sp. TaxID=35761 RepID=UPI0039E6D620
MSTREEWLLAATEAMRPWLAAAGFPLKDVRVSAGWPLGNPRKVVGECHRGTADKVPAIFIHPSLTGAIPVLGTLLHELIHAATPPDTGHRGQFVKAAEALGFTSPWTTTPEGDALKERLAALYADLGDYPHARVSMETRKKQTTRMLKAVCECTEEAYIVRLSGKQAERGAPICPLCKTPMTVEAPEPQENRE